MDREQQSMTQIASTNAGYIDNSSFMMMRVNTAALIDDIKNFLGSRENIITYNKEGRPHEESRQVGVSLANPEGILKLCNIVRMTINQHTAQGNLKPDHYWDLLERARVEIAETIVRKCYDWEIHDSDINTVIDEILRLVELFLTRPIDNKERDSYGQQFASREIIQSQQPRGALSGFASGVGR